MNKIVIKITLGLLLLGLAACTVGRNAKEVLLKEQLLDKRWKLEAMVIENERITGGTDSLVYIEFSDEIIKVVAYCNSFSGLYILGKKDTFSANIESLIRISCEDDLMAFEKLLLRIIEKANKIKIEDDFLFIQQDERTLIMLWDGGEKG